MSNLPEPVGNALDFLIGVTKMKVAWITVPAAGMIIAFYMSVFVGVLVLSLWIAFLQSLLDIERMR